jgi:CheY-like chemotaxis protein
MGTTVLQALFAQPLHRPGVAAVKGTLLLQGTKLLARRRLGLVGGRRYRDQAPKKQQEHRNDIPASDPVVALANGIEPQLIVILSDINIPRMDGLQLLGEIKQRFRDIPVMMVTAYGDDERRRRAGDLGACEFPAKPVDFDALKAQLRQLSTAAG